ncbi:TPA: hypothetical protein H1005_01585 [archaeon]|uniref:SCP domain-containing protein n=1 Tax=Candidatus Naiadarchaeum limnaeum TaxID=2756139 RepID=A0A832XLQ2_9ARCH|nr:hypothetical protein [Candidatus Naiadarchaeales archaeon SRR2090153.bin1042]HIK00173.1 hypothetical protein [Candidatus Naiadarchaeum limnaeum]
MRRKILTYLFLLLSIIFAGCINQSSPNSQDPIQSTPLSEKPTEPPTVVQKFPDETTIIQINNTSIINTSTLERRIHDLINVQRTTFSLNTLEWNNNLSLIARTHSKDMGIRNYFGHKDPEGRNFLYRYNKFGFKCNVVIREEDNLREISNGAENLFLIELKQKDWYKENVRTGERIHISSDYYTSEELANSLVNGWMNSTSHREEILKPFWKTEGIGVFVTDNYTVYATENFC